MMRSVCLFCGARPGRDAAYADGLRAFGAAAARRGITLVYGGGHVGLMGAAADGALAEGGSVIGVIPRSLMDAELAHDGVSELHVVSSMHERKALMTNLSDGFVAAPGGIGTLEELFEIYSWATLGIHAKPVGLLNTRGYYDGLVSFLAHSVREGFVSEAAQHALRVSDNPEALLDELLAYTPPDFGHRLDWSER